MELLQSTTWDSLLQLLANVFTMNTAENCQKFGGELQDEALCVAVFPSESIKTEIFCFALSMETIFELYSPLYLLIAWFLTFLLSFYFLLFMLHLSCFTSDNLTSIINNLNYFYLKSHSLLHLSANKLAV